ncbi:aspartyl-phosphate phosphatase Spo0E family protein [Bacillus sp. 1NLA3E]|uniref:aspartyl-phosphate phosphatase Spo0E family protein n=1 Tax=Bacillus sp. 1NLA3E TaxID=666686 RepID=UPI000247EC6A|nr:aspartyl-phosphate phosphatase Spo0E family protein [Bacillus sp. 1NLA3E]
MILMPIKVDSCEIMRTIESLRKEMIQIGIKEGLQSEKTIKISQRLDVFIAQYQSIIC